MRVEVWYDHMCFNTWVLSWFDDEGYPTETESEYYHYKRDAVARARSIGVPYTIFNRS